MALNVGEVGTGISNTAAATVGGKVDINIDETNKIVRSVTDLALQVHTTAKDMQGVFPPTGSFGQIGTSVEAASRQARDQIAQTVKAVGSLLQKLNVDVQQAATNSALWDQKSSQALSGVGAGPAATPTPTSPTSPTSPTAPTTPTTTPPAPTPANTTPTPGLGSVLGAAVHQAGLGHPAEPHSVEHVLNDLAAVGGGQTQTQPPGSALASPAGFANWLTPQNQASLGLVQVGAGPTSLSAIRPGDVVVATIQPGDSIIGIVGDDGNLYNGGSVGPASGLTNVRGVYRTISSQSTLWGTAV
jgi:hypothetical protein